MKTMLLLIFLLALSQSNAQWTKVSNGMGNFSVYSLASTGNIIFAGAGTYSNPHGVYISSNNGELWMQTSLNNQSVLSLVINGNYVYAGTSTIGVYVSTNSGLNWSQTPLNNREV